LAGNFLLTLGFGLLKSYDRKLIDKAIDVVEIMTRAAILEVKTRGRIDIGISQWYEIANGKTGVLFGWCGFGVATLVDKPIDAQLLWQLGTNIGNIFQMADDLKDFNGDKSLKDQCRDIRNKEPSLPIIFAINSSKNIMVEFEKAFCNEEANMEIEKSLYLRELVLDSGAIDKTKEAMKKELDLLRVGLSKYEGTAGKDKIDNWITNLLNTQA
jgi:geranylgeranyl pyrophosphate synthase